jgi:hypothetical protein
MTSPPSTVHSITRTNTPPGWAPLLPGQVHPRQASAVAQDPDRATGDTGAGAEQQMRSGGGVRLPQLDTGKPRSMITGIPVAEPAMAITNSRSPRLNPAPVENLIHAADRGSAEPNARMRS